ncbi:hypothetical protein BDP27DRAFT_1428690 [Rhodocollybia butyracea]|uniref:Uncharacterized protein n=1 Tax=Rhodocollybia butyracea TaxID=206335 RepID=A0A9P5PD80_9AGAR|nr:hypothetical protein BDP27DRAFT_1428690 [Rhodocollybia butyracea]
MNTKWPIAYSKAKLFLLPPLSTAGVICLHHALKNQTDMMEADQDALEVEVELLSQ